MFWGKSMDDDVQLNWPSNYSTITQSFTLIDLVSVPRNRCCCCRYVTLWIQRGFQARHWGVTFRSAENLGRPGCWDRKVGYDDQRFWCPSVLVALQHHLDKLQLWVFTIAIITVDCGVSCLSWIWIDLRSWLSSGAPIPSGVQALRSWGTSSEERCHWQTVPRSVWQFMKMVSGWWFGCHFWHFPRNIGLRLSSQLTKSYFSEGWPWPTNQRWFHSETAADLFCRRRIPLRSLGISAVLDGRQWFAAGRSSEVGDLLHPLRVDEWIQWNLHGHVRFEYQQCVTICNNMQTTTKKKYINCSEICISASIALVALEGDQICYIMRNELFNNVGFLHCSCVLWT